MDGFAPAVPTLRTCALRALIDYRDSLGDLGYIDHESVRDICSHCDPALLAQIEDETLDGSDRDLSWYTWHLWYKHCVTAYTVPSSNFEVPPLEADCPADYVAPSTTAPEGDWREALEARRAADDLKTNALSNRIRGLYQAADQEKNSRRTGVVAVAAGATKRRRVHAAARAVRAADIATSIKSESHCKLLKSIGLQPAKHRIGSSSTTSTASVGASNGHTFVRGLSAVASPSKRQRPPQGAQAPQGQVTHWANMPKRPAHLHTSSDRPSSTSSPTSYHTTSGSVSGGSAPNSRQHSYSGTLSVPARPSVANGAAPAAHQPASRALGSQGPVRNPGGISGQQGVTAPSGPVVAGRPPPQSNLAAAVAAKAAAAAAAGRSHSAHAPNAGQGSQQPTPQTSSAPSPSSTGSLRAAGGRPLVAPVPPVLPNTAADLAGVTGKAGVTGRAGVTSVPSSSAVADRAGVTGRAAAATLAASGSSLFIPKPHRPAATGTPTQTPPLSPRAGLQQQQRQPQQQQQISKNAAPGAGNPSAASNHEPDRRHGGGGSSSSGRPSPATSDQARPLGKQQQHKRKVPEADGSDRSLPQPQLLDDDELTFTAVPSKKAALTEATTWAPASLRPAAAARPPPAVATAAAATTRPAATAPAPPRASPVTSFSRASMSAPRVVLQAARPAH